MGRFVLLLALLVGQAANLPAQELPSSQPAVEMASSQPALEAAASQPAVGEAIPGGTLEVEIERLTERVDPAADHWTTEVLHDEAKHQLRELFDLIGGGAGVDAGGAGVDLAAVSKFFTDPLPADRVLSLTPTSGVEETVRGARVRQVDATVLPREPATLAAVIHQIRIWRGSDHDGRLEFKIIGVTPPVEGRFETTVLLQGFNVDAKRAVQRDGTWRIGWTKPDGESPPLIDGMEPMRYSEVRLTGLQLMEASAAVLGDLAQHPAVVRGADRWYGRIDVLGEMNYWGHEGIAVGDVNGDGLDDLYAAMGNGVPNLLLVQQADGTVVNKAAEAGVDWLDSTKGVLLVDMDNDGDQDLVAAMANAVVIMTNDGHGVFAPARSLQSASPASFYSLVVADYDQDGDLDIYGCRYVKVQYGVSIPVPFQDANNGPSNHLLRNDGEAGFVDATHLSGMNQNNGRFSLAATWVDYDKDGDLDLYVVNDFGRNNLYRQEGVASGKFVDVAAQANVEDQAAGMGASWSDYDLDGDLDLYVSNMFSSAGRRIAYQPGFLSGASAEQLKSVQEHSLGNSLMQNQGDGTFVNVADTAGVRLGRWSWGSRFVDLNNDGYDDLVVPNGFLTNDRQDDL